MPSSTQVAFLAIAFLLGLNIRHSFDLGQLPKGIPSIGLQAPSNMSSLLPIDREISKTAIIAALVTNATEDLHELCNALVSLVHLPDMRNDKRQLAGVIVFNEGNLLYRHKVLLQRCTPRPVTFALVDFNAYPDGFDPNNETSVWRKREDYHKWGYHQMIRFFVTHIWNHDAVQTYETIMRLDSDSCWTATDPSKVPDAAFEALPELLPEYIYQHNLELSDNSDVCDGLYDFAQNYIDEHNITVANPSLWQEFERTWKGDKRCQMFYNNFEVSRISFMQQPQVRLWHEQVSEHKPFGIFRFRWGDAIIRRVTMAMFATPGSILGPPSSGYKHVCRDNPDFVFQKEFYQNYNLVH